jgi:hypothetical protein
MSPALFNVFNDESVGRFDITWEFVSCDANSVLSSGQA